jgi:hypothetical protein
MMLNLDSERFDTLREELCPALRWKGQFIEAEHDPTVPPTNDGLFWCMHTQTCIGPDRAAIRRSPFAIGQNEDAQLNDREILAK